MKRKENRNYALKFVGIIVGLLLVGSFALAAVDGITLNIDTVNISGIGERIEGLWGAITQNKTRFNQGIEIDGGGLDVSGGNVDFDNNLNVDGTITVDSTATLSGNITLGDASSDTITGTGAFTQNGTFSFDDNATTTPAEHTHAPIKFDLDLTASSTAMDTNIVAGYWCNDGAALEFRPDTWSLNIETAATDFGFNKITIGTTTLTSGEDFTSGTYSLTNTSTATLGSLEIASSTTGRFNLAGMAGADGDIYNRDGADYASSTLGNYFEDNDGYSYNTSTPATLAHGDCVVVAYNSDSATSSDSISTGGGASFDGTFIVPDVWILSAD